MSSPASDLVAISGAHKLPAIIPGPNYEEEKIEKLLQKFPGVDRGLIELLLNDQDGDFKDVQAMLAKMCKKQKT